jgi:hypothetical protein
VIGGRPNGGYVLGISLRALARVLPMPDPLVVSAFFLRPTRSGAVEIHTEVARGGRRIATGTARMLQDGKETMRVTASFSDLVAPGGRTVMLDERPPLPPPEDTRDPGSQPDRSGGVPRGRAPGLGDGRAGGPAGHGVLDAPPRRARAGHALPPRAGGRGRPGDPRPGGDRLGHDRADRARAGPARARLARLPVDHALRHRRPDEEDFEIWDSTGALVAQSRQLALLP